MYSVDEVLFLRSYLRLCRPTTLNILAEITIGGLKGHFLEQADVEHVEGNECLSVAEILRNRILCFSIVPLFIVIRKLK